MAKNIKPSAKRSALKKMVKGKVIGKSPTGASPFPMDNGLGKDSLKSKSGSDVTGGGGSNLGTRGVF
jgi:hypothetical protein